MRKYLLPENGHFYKANLHCHTTCSDGRKTAAEVKEIYQKRGYSIVAYTDHDVLLSHDELNDENFLALHGFEIELSDYSEGVTSETRRTCHICMVALEPDNMVEPCWHRTLHQHHYFYGNAKNYAGEIKKETAELTGAYLDENRGALRITDLNPADYSNSLFPDGVYHLYDYQFFYRNLQQNVAVRLESYLHQ